MEKITKGPLVSILDPTNELYLDGSHNEDAARNLNNSLNQLPQKKLCVILGMINTKDPISYLSQFTNIDTLTVITIPDEENAISSSELRSKLNRYYKNINEANSVKDALKSINRNYKNVRILICGSLYLAGKVLSMN